jgi:hypothetical protein
MKVSKTWERCVIETKDTVIKRELSESELVRGMTGKIIYPFWSKERLQNEAATLRFIAENTSIPVPTCRVYTAEGLYHLETKRIANGILLADVERHFRTAAIQAVEEQMNTIILPQLRSLRRKVIGSVDATIPVFPPQRVYGLDRRYWPQISSATETFVMCHNDLGAQNLFVNPSKNFEITGIIDWEFSGYFPSYFELPLWREFEWEGGKKMYDDARPRALEFFRLKSENLQDNRFVTRHNDLI